MNKFYLIAFLAGLAQLAATPGAYGQQAASGSSPQVPTEKQTVPGLYVTAKEAYDKWRVDMGWSTST